MLDFEEAIVSMMDSPEFQEKIVVDMDEKQLENMPMRSEKQRLDPWSRKRKHKKKMVRRFLSMNPAMDYSNMFGQNCRQAIYIHYPRVFDGEYQDHRMEYALNPYTKVFLSPRGDLRVYHGNISYIRGSYTLANKDKSLQRVTNRRIRKASMEDIATTSFSYCKKCYGPWVDDLW